MGLCKCPKRQVTNQFCFEHRVNVCENCMVVNHKRCTVQSYIQWLKDSDFDSNCSLCGYVRDHEDCVRLICYHVFHWKCLNARQQMLPSTTSPSGHTCPICCSPIFPSNNLKSPLADVLRLQLGNVNWSGIEFCSKMLDDNRTSQLGEISCGSSIEIFKIINSTSTSKENRRFKSQNEFMSSSTSNPTIDIVDLPALPSVLHIDSHVNVANSRRVASTTREQLVYWDDDDNKYQRRAPQEIYSRWSRRLYTPLMKPVWRKSLFVVVLALLGFVCMMYFMAAYEKVSKMDMKLNRISANPNMPRAEE